jgi:hypothetical protein
MLCVGAVADAGAQQPKPKARVRSFHPPNGFIADSITAVKVAEVVLVSVWGAESIESRKPLIATLERGVWSVRSGSAEGMVGDVVLEIRKKDGRLLRTWLYK